MNELKHNHKKENPNEKPLSNDTVKEKWENLSENRKKQLNKKYMQLREKFNEDIKNYKKENGCESKKLSKKVEKKEVKRKRKEKDKDAPKKPSNGYMFFYKE